MAIEQLSSYLAESNAAAIDYSSRCVSKCGMKDSTNKKLILLIDEPSLGSSKGTMTPLT
jgi:hypothetical protein